MMESKQTWRIINADVMDGLRQLPDGSVHCIVTSPPYWGLRDYGHEGQIGLERTWPEYVAKMVEVFREARRVLRDDGTLWLNLGDGYANNAITGLTPKSLIGIPWRVAFALQDDGWCLRQDIIWHKPNPMPESVQDRCTKAHEYLFLLSKSARYYYDAKAIMEPAIHAGEIVKNNGGKNSKMGAYGSTRGGFLKSEGVTVKEIRNKRSVWSITTKPFAGAHFAVMPEALAEPCILAGCPAGGTVLDPFSGAATVGVVAMRHGRSYVGIELNPEYVEIGRRRIIGDAPILNKDVEVV